HDPSSRLTELGGQDLLPLTTMDGTATIDGTAPTATQGPINACYQSVAAANAAALAATTSLTDNCDPAPTKSVHTSASAACSTPVVIRVQDSCGNFTDYTYPTRVDNTAPVFDTCPSDISVDGCTATVDPGTPTAHDNCDPAPVITGSRSDGHALSDPYPPGTTTI